MYDGALSEMKQQYGKYREVNMSLFQNEDYEQLHFEEDLKLGGDDLKVVRNKEKITVTFHSDKISVSDLLSYILNKTQVKDISVNDVNIEEIVCRMYGNGVSAS